MANQGFVNEGNDSRWTTLWGLGPWLSQHLSFKCGWDPISIYFLFPLGFGINIPAIWTGKPGTVLHLRLMLYRYDTTWKGYLFFSAAAKILDHPTFY